MAAKAMSSEGSAVDAHVNWLILAANGAWVK